MSRRPSPAARRSLLRLVALALVLVPVAGCTSAGPPPQPAALAAGSGGAAAASSPVAELQAGLAALLVERAYVVAAATEAVAASGGAIAPGPEAAVAALDANSVALADLLGATFSEARLPLLNALRLEDRLLARHAVQLGDGDEAGARQVRAELEQAQGALARVVRRVVPKLDADEVAARLGADVRAQLAAGSYDQLHETAVEASGTARLLAAGIAADRELGLAGTDAVRLRADLSGLLTEHVMLSAALARELREQGSAAASARAGLAVNAELLADELGSAYAASRGAFLRSWTAHLTRLERYAASRAAGGEAAAERGLVTGYPAELSRLIAEHVRGLPARSAQTELERALAAQLTALDTAAADTASAPEALRAAAAAVLPAAALVSAAVAEDLRLQ